MNKPLTAEEAKNLTFPCLLEVWDGNRQSSFPIIIIVNGFEENIYLSRNGENWNYAALPSPEVAEAMRKQFGTQSEYPKRMLVWGDDETKAEQRIVIADLGERAIDRYIVVIERDEIKWQNGEVFDWFYYNHAKPIPEPEPEQIAQEIAELRQRLAELEAKHSQQS